MTTSLKEVAYHEAGHAVVTISRGHRVKAVTIKPDADGSCLGYSERYPIPPGILAKLVAGDTTSRSTKLWIEAEAVILLAGRHAGRLVTNGRNNHRGATSDNERVNYLAQYATDSEREAKAFIKLMDIRAEQLVNDHIWMACIEAVAAKLLVRETLSGNEVRSVVADTVDAMRRKRTRK